MDGRGLAGVNLKWDKAGFLFPPHAGRSVCVEKAIIWFLEEEGAPGIFLERLQVD